MFRRLISIILALLILGAVPVLGDSSGLQDDNSDAIVIEGPVQAINVNIITIANIDIVVQADDPLLSSLTVGDVVQVGGQVDDSTGVISIQADTLTLTGDSIMSPVITLRGPVQAVNVNIVTIFNLNIQFNPDDPLLTELNAGDILEVNGNLVISGGAQIIVPVQVVIILNIPASEPPAGQGAAVDVEKYISTDNAVWQDADDAPGPEVDLQTPVSFRFVVSNTGQTELSALSLLDDVYDLSGCSVPAALAVGAFFECTIGPFPAEAGQHSDLATVQATAGDVIVQDSDAAHYFGGDRPSIDVEKQVSTDNANWQDADSAPGLAVAPGSEVYFRFAVSNSGSVPLTAITLSDDVFDTSSCTLPTSLDPGASFECVIGPFEATDTHTDTATVSADFNGTLVTDTDSANYTTGELPPVTIVIEGPVQAINVNIITIYNIDVEVDQNDPILTQIAIGDVIRVEGSSVSSGDTIIIVAVNIVIINIDQDIITGGDDNQGDDDDDGGGFVVRFSKDACKGGGWQTLSRADGSGFKNQGDCIQYANTGK